MYKANHLSPENQKILKKLLEERKFFTDRLIDTSSTVENEKYTFFLEDIDQKILNLNPYPIKQYSDGRWKSYIYDPDNKYNRRQIVASSKEILKYRILNVIIDSFSNNSITLQECYEKWLPTTVGTVKDKTVYEYKNEFVTYIQGTSLADMHIKDIQHYHVDRFIKESIQAKKIKSSKRLANIITVLRKIFEFASINNYLNEKNPVLNVKAISYKVLINQQNSVKNTLKKENAIMLNNDSSIFKIASKKCFSNDERTKILTYLEKSTEPIDLLLALNFYLGARAGELTVLKKTDYDSDNKRIIIARSQGRELTLNNDLSFSASTYTFDNEIKGKQKSGIRILPITPASEKILNKLFQLDSSPYLASKNGIPFTTDMINKRLAKVCRKAAVPYLSSHAIRFSVATQLANNNLPISELSSYLGHSDTRTTWHYIQSRELSEASQELIRNALTIDKTK